MTLMQHWHIDTVPTLASVDLDRVAARIVALMREERLAALTVRPEFHAVTSRSEDPVGQEPS